MKMDIFFFVTTISVVVVPVFIIILFYYLIKSFRKLKILLDKVENNINNVSDDIKDITNQIKESFIFNFLFPKKRKKKKNS